MDRTDSPNRYRERDRYRERRRPTRPSDYDYDDRGFMDRAGDEVRSWFGDDEARRRRALDEQYDDRYDNEFGDRVERRFDGDRRRYDRGRYDRGRLDADDFDRDYNRDYARRYGTEPRGYRGRQESRKGSALRDDAAFIDRRDRYSRSNRPYERDTRFGFDFGLRDQDRDVVNRRSYDLPNDLGYGGQRGPHAGRGPQGYRRSATRIVEDVSERLTDHGYLDATNIRVSAEEGEVTLRGTVGSRSEKRLADDLAERVRGVRDVHNRLTIVPGAERSQATTTEAATSDTTTSGTTTSGATGGGATS